MLKVKDNIEQIYSSLPTPTALFSKDESGDWHLEWQNNAAVQYWGHFELSEHPELKLELMDCVTKSGATHFDYIYSNTLEAFSLLGTPMDDSVLIHLISDSAAKQSMQSQDSQTDVFQKVIEATEQGILDWNMVTDEVQLNAKAYELLGGSNPYGVITFDKLLNGVHPEDVNTVTDEIEQHIVTDWPLKVEFRVINKYHQHVWIKLKGHVQRKNDEAVRFLGTVEDVSERKYMQLEVANREALIEQMIDAFPMSIYVKDAQGIYRFFNNAAEASSGFKRNKVIGSSDYEIYSMPISSEKAEADKSIQIANETAIYEEASDDGEAWLLMGKKPMQVVQGSKEETWLLSFALDITQRKKMEQALEEAREKAEEGARAKAAFLSVMSHEIRTPLNSVIGNASLLLSEKLEGEMANQIEMIKRSGEHLLYLINDILDFNKLEAGKVELEHSPFNLTQQIDTVLEMSKTNASTKGIFLNAETSACVGEHYIGDEGRLRQILLNLVGNAIKFTSEGGVTVKVSHQHSLIRFEVVDSGIGIAEKNIPKLFSEFTQAEASTSKNFGGTGLGLAICKKLVTAMGGTIGIESEEGVGSTFWFEIPFEEVKSTGASDGVIEQFMDCEAEPMSILVAEDNLPNQFLIKAILTKLGHRVSIANNGYEVLDQLVESQSSAFDMVLMDMNMPEMGGLEATQHIRNDSNHDYQSIPVIALTANPCSQVADSIKEYDLNGCLTKPIEVDKLKRVLAKWSPRTSGV